MNLLKKIGVGVVAYLVIKWGLIGLVIWWFSRYDWFETRHAFYIIPVVICVVAGGFWLFSRWRKAKTPEKID